MRKKDRSEINLNDKIMFYGLIAMFISAIIIVASGKNCDPYCQERHSPQYLESRDYIDYRRGRDFQNHREEHWWDNPAKTYIKLKILDLAP